MGKIDFNKHCLEALFNKIPEIKEVQGQLKEELESHLKRGYGAHIIFEDIFSYFVFDFISKSNPSQNEQDIIKRSFELIEELANHKDFDVRCVAEVSFIEPLLDKIKPTKKIEEYLHPKSLEMAREIGAFRFGFDPYTWEKKNN